jgi:cyanophycinase-like exopeptidase
VKLAPLLTEVVLIGIDEETGLMNDGPEGRWTVYGKGAVTLYRRGNVDTLYHGQELALPSQDKGLQRIASDSFQTHK